MAVEVASYAYSADRIDRAVEMVVTYDYSYVTTADLADDALDSWHKLPDGSYRRGRHMLEISPTGLITISLVRGPAWPQ